MSRCAITVWLYDGVVAGGGATGRGCHLIMPGKNEHSRDLASLVPTLSFVHCASISISSKDTPDTEGRLHYVYSDNGSSIEEWRIPL